MFIRNIFLIITSLCSASFFSQSAFYETDNVREIHIDFYDENWDHLLDSLYIQGEGGRILANLQIDGSTYYSVGVRYKGYSSVSINNIKNPFNIKLDHVIEDQNHEGIDKLKLSNVIHDPSFLREVLSYEVCRKYMPASNANYANLYINGVLWGLYTNVEAVNKEFLIENFGSKYSPFFKCNPEDLNIQIGGLNSDLSNSHGSDSASYMQYYDIESDFGWSHLYHLIDTLNTVPEEIEKVLNVDRTLWMHALNYSMINFDSYIGYGQNYYMYLDQANQFNPIIWDLNMSFGSFRLTDASQLFYGGFDINQAQNMDPLVHHNFISVAPRPLMTSLFESERNRKMYLAHIRTIVEENFQNQEYSTRAESLKAMIYQEVLNDPNKFYSNDDFIANIYDQVSLVSSICPGITQLMDARSEYLSSYPGYSGEPEISNISNNSEGAQLLGNDVWIHAQISDATYAQVSYRFGNNQRFVSVEMFDDGAHNDGNAGDGLYGCKIEGCSNSVDYYLYADNDASGVFSPARAAHEFYNMNSNLSSGDLVINEVMSNNVSVAADPSGNFEDWVELYNTTDFPISTNNLYLSDNLANLLKWDLPNHVIPANGYYVVWADEDGGQGEEHANFQLSNAGEIITMSNADSTFIDDVSYLMQNIDVAFGRSPNGIGDFTMLTPTFNSSNDMTSVIADQEVNVFTASPNPFTDCLTIDSSGSYSVIDLFGRQVMQGSDNVINTSGWTPGVYFLQMDHSRVAPVKLLKIRS
jgi:spore coat protein CotH